MSIAHPSMPAMLALLCAATLAGPLRAETPPPAPLARFTFNGHADAEPPGQATFNLRHTSFQDDALRLNGVYEFGPEPEGYHAVCGTPSFRYTAFTVAMRFKAEQFGGSKSTLLVGGTSYRWFGLQRSTQGNLAVMFNNGQLIQEIQDTPLEAGRWTVVACSVDLAGKKVFPYLDGKPAAAFDLPADFQLNVIGTPAEEQGKVWAFVNYSNTNLFHGLVDELILHNRLLSAEEIGQQFKRLPTQRSGVQVGEKSPADPTGAAQLSKLEREVFDLVNRERLKARLPPLKASRQLTDAARAHAANMARQRTLNHTLDGKRFDQRIAATGYRFSAAGENIYWGMTAADAMAGWMRSPGHRQNILSPSYQEIGIGVSTEASLQKYWTQVFAVPVPAARAPLPPARAPSQPAASR